MAQIDFRTLDFGRASSEAEVARDSERFLATYFDRWEILPNARRRAPDYFLVIGPKGSGKTGVGEATRLEMTRVYGEHAVFARSLDLDQVSPTLMPLTSLTKKLVPQQASAITDSAWRLFLGIRFLELLMQDQSSDAHQEGRLGRLHSELVSTGLAESDFPTVLRKVRENRLSFKVAQIGLETVTTSADEIAISTLGAAIQKQILAVQSANHFMLVVDGLDRIVSDNDSYWLTLAALLRVGDEYHRRFVSAKADLRLLVMCRSDVFRRIQFADADKIAIDSAKSIDWSAHLTKPVDSPLWDYLAAKAKISVQGLLDLFPSDVAVGQRQSDKSRQIPILEYLISSTRSTPREMSSLMRRLQEVMPPGGFITSERVREAVDLFASRDLLTMLVAEATGLIEAQVGRRLGELLSHLPAATYVERSDIEAALQTSELSTELAGELCEFLFLAGVLGNYDPRTGYVQFYHRRDTYGFKAKGPWHLHKGLMYALNIPYSKGAAR